MDGWQERAFYFQNFESTFVNSITECFFFDLAGQSHRQLIDENKE